MLKDVVNQFEKIYLATGYTDLRRGIDGLAEVIHREFDLNPYDKDILFLFCGRRSCQTAHYGRRFLRINFGVFAYPIVPRDFRLHGIIRGTARYRSLISAA